MTSSTAVGWRATLPVLVTVLALALMGADRPSGPDEGPVPTDKQLAASVQVWDPAGSVKVYRIDGSVRSVEKEVKQGADTVLVLDSDILFASGSAELSPAASIKIGQLLARAPRGGALNVTGHTDAVGDDALNLDLSRRRAAAVAAAITAARPDLAPAVDGRGESQPAAPNSDADGREQNRRVEVRYTG